MLLRFLTGRLVSRVAMAALLTLLAVWAIQNYQDLAAAERRSAELQRRIVAVRADIRRLERETEALRTDPATVERVARQQLGLVREGEVVVVLPESPVVTSDEVTK